MLVLIKQVLKSLKQSAILIIALIFICTITIFTSFSALYINSNIDDSLTKIRTEGNSSNIIVDKKYNDSSVEYIYDIDADQANTLNKRHIFVSNYKYDPVIANNNIIFPYNTSDFNGPNVNDKWTIPVGDIQPSYYDQYLPRYENRKKGINRGLSASVTDVLFKNGPEITIGTALNSWLGIGYSMMNLKTKEKLFDPQYLVFSGNNPTNRKLIGYFVDGNISNAVTASESAFIPTRRNFTSTDVGAAKLPLIPLHRDIIGDIVITNDTTPFAEYSDLRNDFVNVLKNNSTFSDSLTTPEMANFYNIKLNIAELTGINKFVYEQIVAIKNIDHSLLNINQMKVLAKFNSLDLFGTEIPIRQLWIKDYLDANPSTTPLPPPTEKEAISFFLANRAAQLEENFKNFVVGNRDYFIEEYLFRNGYELNNNRSFSFYDRDSKKNLLIAEKNTNIDDVTNKASDWINKLVLSSGSTPFLDSNNFKFFLNMLPDLLYALPSKIAPTQLELEKAFFLGTKYYINVLLNATIVGNANLLSGWQDLLPTVKYLFDNLVIDQNGEIILPQFTEPTQPGYLKPGMLQKFFAWINVPSLGGSYDEYALQILFKAGVSTITSPINFFIPNFSSYQVIVNDKFLSAFNKKVIPSSIFSDLQKKNYTEFNSAINDKTNQFFVSEEYKIKIGNKQFIITGSGISPETIYPSPSLSSIIINPENDILLYVDKYGYETLRNLYVPSGENNYFAIDADQSKSFTSIDKLNEVLMPIMNGGKEKVCYSISDIFTATNILSLRYSFPDFLQNYISIFSLVAVIGLVVIGLYLSFIIMKKYIDKNRVQIALCKANGFSTFKLALGLSSISIIVAIFGGTIGYLIAFFLQQFIYSIIAPYMFIPILFNVFNPIGFISGIIIIAILFFLFVYINLYFLFKKPINLIISQSVEIKSNKLLNILKYSKLPMTANLKFKFAISMSNIPRTFFYLTSSFIGITVISFGLSFVSKFHESQELTALNKNYVYSIDLQTPNEQSGLFKSQDYSQLGFSDTTLGIDSLYPNAFTSTRFPYISSDLKVLNIDGTQKINEQGEPLYFSNLLLPSYELYQVFNNQIDIFRDVSFSKWILDFDIPVLNVNVWDTLKNFFPLDLVARIEAENQIFINAILDHPIIGPEFKTFAKQIGTTNTWELDGSKILTKQQIVGNILPVDVLSPAFITFIGKVYGDENLSNLDVKLSYASLGYDKKSSETYTYVNASFLNKSLSNKNDNKSIKIYGIDPFSKFVTLKNNNKEFIGAKLNSTHSDGKTKYMIINNGASLKYGLNIGDRIDFSVMNSYFRYSEKIFNSYASDILLPNQTITTFNNDQVFQIIDISSTSFGEEFFISQKDANEILGLNKGKFIRDVVVSKTQPIPPPNGPPINPNRIYYETLSIPYTNNASYIPFNGIYTSDIDPVILSNALSYYSFINLYGNFSRITNGPGSPFYMQINGSNINLIIEAIMPTDQTLFASFNAHMKTLIPKFTDLDKWAFNEEIYKLYGSTPLIIDYLLQNFGSEAMAISLNNFNNYFATQEIYTSIVSTLTLIQNLLVAIIIPLVSIIILIMSSIMLEEIKRMIFVFKTLGYSDRQNIFNIIFNFAPIYLFSIAIGFLVTFLLFLSMQYLIYFLTAIFISSSVNVLNWIYACAAILGIIFVNIIFTIILYKKDKLSNAMKNNF